MSVYNLQFFDKLMELRMYLHLQIGRSMSANASQSDSRAKHSFLSSIRERKGSLFPSSLSRIEEEDGGPGFTVGSYNPKKLVRTSSKASNVSKMSHSL